MNTYAEMMKLKWEDSDVPLTSKEALARVRREESINRRALTLGVDLQWDRAGTSETSKVNLAILEPEKKGFDPQFLSAKLIVADDEWLDYMQDVAKNQGFTITPWQPDWRLGQVDEEHHGRPSHTAQRVDMSSRNERPNYVWVDVEANQVKDFMPSGKYAHRVRQEILDARLRRGVDSMCTYIRDVCSENMRSLYVKLEISWRGEVVGEASTGCYETTAHGKKLDLECAWLALDLLGEAWDQVQAWASKAVRDAEAKAAMAARQIALLPEAALQQARQEEAVKAAEIAARLDAHQNRRH